MKKIIFIFLFPLFVTAQDYSHDLSENVNGLISSDQGTFLILDDGYILLEKHDPLEEYYRKIYNDSTIVNPNTELKEDFDLSLIPFLLPSINKDNKINFSKPLELGLFFQLNKMDKFFLTPYAESVIDSLNDRK